MVSTIPSIPYPWQQDTWQQFPSQVEHNRLPHALLIHGPSGIGKLHYAHCMAGYLLCQTPKSGLACGECRSCQLIQAGTHPDQWVVTPEEKSKQIRIDQIRRLSEVITATARQTGRKVAILAPAERLNINAANALLKNLEEPTNDTFFILVSNRISGVMATIRSRCQIVPLSTPAPDKVTHWLKESGLTTNAELVLSLAAGAPLAAKRLYSETASEQLTRFYGGLQRQFEGTTADLSVAAEWQLLELEQLLDWWLHLIHRILVQQIRVTRTELPETDLPETRLSKTGVPETAAGHSTAVTDESRLNFVGSLLTVERLSWNLKPQWLYRFVDKLLALKQQFAQGANPNRQLLVEELLLDWYAIIRAEQHGRT